MSNNIENGVNNSVSTDEGFIPMNNVVQDGSEPINGDFTKDDYLFNVSLLYEYIVIKWNHLALSRMLSKETLSFEVDAQLLKEVIENLERSRICVDDLSDNMVEHVVH